MFFDEVQLELEGGKGGNGMVFFHREKFVECGAPDGGDGGNGGNVVLEADDNYNTLQHFTGLKHFTAKNGEGGYKNNMGGRGAEDLILKVPVGTMVYDQDSGDLMVDLNKHGQRFLAARGGRGGYGNSNFMSSTRQAPDFAELGDVGELKKVRFELRLVADVGLVGFPSAGKSTFISHVSSARPKIAAYPFTTLIPNLGVVYLSDFGGNKNQSFVIADMPGIIEGASEGKGLGDAFLKHISRTATLVFVLDPFSYEGRSIVDQYKTLLEELKKYDPKLAKKDHLVAMNKIDSVPDEDREQLQKEFLKAYPKLKTKFRQISGVSGEGMNKLVFELYKMVEKHKEKAPEVKPDTEMLEYKPHALVDEHSFEVVKVKTIDAVNFPEPVWGQSIDPEVMSKRVLFKVTGKRIEQISRMTNVMQEGALARVYDVLKKMKIHNALVRENAKTGDYVLIGPHVYEFHDL
jgi:GTP-binding protein